jgi:uncharacterized lipoprotein YmbA
MSIITAKAMTLVLCAAGAALAGCAQPGEPVRHYVIDTVEQRPAVRPVSGQPGPIVAVSPIGLPEYLNQSGIVTRTQGNEVVRAESHVWAGPLAEEIARAVAENLSAMLPTERVTLGAARRAIPVDYTVDIEIVNFERDAAGNAVDLVARWMLFRGDERNLLVMRRSQFRKPASGSDYRDTVAVMGEAVAALSEEIALAIGQGPDRRGGDRWTAERSTRRPNGDALSGAPARRR